MNDLPQEPALRQRLGGRWAISWQAFVITAPLAVLALAITSSGSARQIAGWIVAGLAAMLLVGAWTFCMHRIVFRNRAVTPVAVPIVIAFAAMAALIFIIATAAFGQVLGLPSVNGPLPRAIPTLVVATWWGVILVLLLEARWRFGYERDALVERAVRQKLASLQGTEVAARIRESVQDEIAAQLSEARANLEHRWDYSTSAENNPTALAAEIRDTASRAIRPLSHELAERVGSGYPRPGIADFLRNIVTRQPFRPLIVSVIYLITTAPRELEAKDGLSGLGSITLTVALIWTIMIMANRAMRMWPQRHATLFIVGVVALELPSLVIPLVASRYFDASINWYDALVSIGFGIILILVTSGFGSVRASRQDLLRTFSSDVSEDEVATIAQSEALAVAAREAAGILHGPVQTKLVACAMAIEQANSTGDLVAVNQALMQARAILEQPMPTGVPGSDESIGEQVERKAALWSGLTRVHVDIDPGAATVTGPLANDVAAIVEEAIANAVQHGGAIGVDVGIHTEQDGLLLDITDDGRGPGGGPAGLGSGLLDRVAPGWRLTARSRGSRLIARVPLA